MADKNRKNSLLADIGLFIVALMWGGGFIVTKNTVEIMDPIYLNFLRFFIASIFMVVIFIKRLKKLTREEVKHGSLMGSFLFVAFMGMNIGVKYTTVSKQAFITATNVVIVPFIVWLTSKKKPNLYEIISAIICFIGLSIISYDGKINFNYGDSLSFIGAIFFACHITSVGYYSKNHDPIRLTIVQFVVVSILSLVACISLKSDMSSLSGPAIKGVLYMGIFSTLLGFGIQNIAQKHTSSTHAAIILSLESVIGAVLSVIILKEELTLKFVFGCLVILLAVIGSELDFKFKKIK